jgi:hypothetical protein
MTYHVLKSDGKPRAGVTKPMMPGVPRSWLPYHRWRTSMRRTTRRRLGASIKLAPTDIPYVGRFSILADPLGAALGGLQPAGK